MRLLRKIFGWLLTAWGAFVLLAIVISAITGYFSHEDDAIGLIVALLFIALTPAAIGYAFITYKPKAKIQKQPSPKKEEPTFRNIDQGADAFITSKYKKVFIVDESFVNNPTHHLEYIDYHQSFTERDISIFNTEESGHIDAYCFLRKAKRTFRTLNVVRLVNLETGEVEIENGQYVS